MFLLTFYYLTMVDVGNAFCYVSIMVNLTIFKKTVFDCCSNDLEQIQVKPKIPRCKSSFCEDRIYNNLMYNDIYIVHQYLHGGRWLSVLEFRGTWIGWNLIRVKTTNSNYVQ